MISRGAAPIRRLLQQGSAYTAASALELLSRALVLPILTRTLTVEEFGLVAIALIAIQFATILGGGGLPGAITVLFFTDDGRLKARSLIPIMAITAAGVLVLADATGAIWSRIFGATSYGTDLRIAVWAALPYAVVKAVQALLQAAERVAAFVGLSLILTVGAQGLGIVLMFTADAPVTGYLAGLAIGYAIAAVAGLLAVRPSTWAMRGRWDVIRTAFGISLPVLVHGLAGYVLAAGDRLVIVELEGLELVGQYQVAFVIGSLGLSVVVAASRAWMPMIYGAPDEERWNVLGETTTAFYRLATPIVGGLALGAPLILFVAAPAEYEPADLTPVAAILALTVTVQVAYLSRAIILFQRQQTRTLAWASPLSAVVNIALNFALIPWLSIIGAAIATVLANGLLAALAGLAARRMASVPWQRGETARAWVLSGSLLAVGVLLPAVGGVWLVVRLVAATLCFPWLLFEARRLMARPA